MSHKISSINLNPKNMYFARSPVQGVQQLVWVVLLLLLLLLLSLLLRTVTVTITRFLIR